MTVASVVASITKMVRNAPAQKREVATQKAMQMDNSSNLFNEAVKKAKVVGIVAY